MKTLSALLLTLLLASPVFAQGVLVPTFDDIPPAYDDTELRTRIGAIEEALNKLSDNVPPPPGEEPPVGPDPEEPDGQKLIELSDLRLIGGWRLEANNATGFIQGGLAVDPETNRLWCDAGHRQGIIEFTLPPMSPGDDFFNYATAPISKRIHDTDLWGTTPPTNFRSMDACWHPASQKLFVSGRSTYHTATKDRDYWLASVDNEGNIERYKVDGPMQSLGNGIELRPDGGLAFIAGGYESGQQSMLGPSLATFEVESLPAIDWKIRFALFGSTDHRNKSLIEKRQPDYWHGPAVGQPEGGLMNLLLPDDGVGYWQADSIVGGCWIETPTHRGVLYNVTQGTQDLRYDRQARTFAASQNVVTSLYVYDPLDFSLPGKFERWPMPEGMKQPDGPRKLSTRRGMAWAGNRLYVIHTQAHGSRHEAWPVVMVYELGSGE